jgi:hypothetical protein
MAVQATFGELPWDIFTKVIWETDLLHIAAGSLGIDSVHIKIYDRIIALDCAGKESTPGTSVVSHKSVQKVWLRHQAIFLTP